MNSLAGGAGASGSSLFQRNGTLAQDLARNTQEVRPGAALITQQQHHARLDHSNRLEPVESCHYKMLSGVVSQFMQSTAFT